MRVVRALPRLATADGMSDPERKQGALFADAVNDFTSRHHPKAMPVPHEFPACGHKGTIYLGSEV
jgi:hypothetical protein